MSILSIVGYFASILMGVALGLTGGGGSILTVPILSYLFFVDALQATTYSLGIVGLVALWGAWGAYRSRELHLSRAIVFGIPGIIGVIISRRILLPSLPSEISFFSLTVSQNSIILLLFAFLMLAASYSMIQSARKSEDLAKKQIIEKNISLFSMFVSGLSVGLVSGFVGAGGGFLIVPALVRFGHLDIKQAVGTSLFVITLQSIIGVLSDFSLLSKLNFGLFLSIVLLALIGMTVGSKVRHKLSQKKLKMGFGIFVLVMAIFILFKEIGKGSL